LLSSLVEVRALSTMVGPRYSLLSGLGQVVSAYEGGRRIGEIANTIP
jgi:hypothetical protein